MIPIRSALAGILACGLTWQCAAAKGAEGAGIAKPPLDLARGKQVAEAGVSTTPRSPAALDAALVEYDRLQEQLTKLREVERRAADPFARTANGKKADESLQSVREKVAAMESRTEKAAADIDHLGGQRSCAVSRLYWYTDLEEAKQESARRGRPILSLRMLGKLTDEYSCANSRFFRTALYSNKRLSEFLRTNFVLHWQSVRPVPHVTIDFGDGRKLERTLTGNSAHYVLASDGTPIDVLPGLYSPLAFRQLAWEACNFYVRYQKATPADRVVLLREYHKSQNDELLARWDYDIQRLGAEQAELARVKINYALQTARATNPAVPEEVSPKAVKAAAKAVGKSAAEAPILRFARLGGTWIERGMDDDLWQAVADLHRGDVQLDEASVALMRREAPLAAVAARRSFSKSLVEDPILRVVRTFEDAMSLDTVRNEYLLHRRIHEEFVNGNAATANVDALNEWVYSQLFLTPSSDPWLGLAPRDVYTALEQDGRTEAAQTGGGGL